MARELFRLSLVDGRLAPERVSRAVKWLAGKKPRNYLSVLEAYRRLVRLEAAKRQAVVESATALGEDTKSGIVREIKGKYGSDVTVEFKVRPELLGGLRIKVGSDVWDGSVNSRLTRLSQQF